MFGDAPVSRIREVGLELERLAAVLRALEPETAASPPVPTFVYVFRSPDAMAPYAPRVGGRPASAGAFFQQNRDGNAIVLTARWNTDPRPVAYHEYIHDVLRRRLPPQPTWYEEGLADYYSTFRSRGDEAQVGMIREDYLSLLLSSGLIPLERLFAVDHESPDYTERRRQGVFYAQSWAFVHYLLQGTPQRTPELVRFLDLLRKGRPRDEAFREAFGKDPSSFLPELAAYVRGGRFTYTRLRLSELRVPHESEVRPLSNEEALVRLGDLLAHGGADRLADAERHYEAVLASSPENAGALGGLGFVRLRQERRDEAGALYRRAVAAGSSDFRVHFHYGRWLQDTLAREAREARAARELAPDSRALLEETRAAFRRAIVLRPEFAEAHAALGRTYLIDDGGPVDEGIAALERARAELPERADVAVDLAELRFRQRRSTEAAAVPEPGPSEPGWRRSELEKRIDAINGLLESGREAEALASLDEVIARTEGEIRVEMENQRDRLRKTAARNRAVADYNAAIDLYNRRDYEKALEAFRRLAEASPDPGIAEAARRKASELAGWIARPGTGPGS